MNSDGHNLLGRVVGHIRVVKELGEGGMGMVYEGFDETLQRSVALKVVHARYRLNPEAKARFLREARILSQLNHDRICRVYDYIEGDDHDILVMELVEGLSLRRAFARGIRDVEKFEIAEQLLDVLVTVHGAGVVHRDLKPENVMLMSDGGIKVLDFGLARSLEVEASLVGETVITEPAGSQPDFDSDHTAAVVPVTGRPSGSDRVQAPSEPSEATTVKTSHGMVLGTAGYMSPEQARGEGATAASDLYSLGLILQELFTGTRAFRTGLQKEALLLKASRGETEPVVGVSSDLKALIERLTSPEPAARPTALDAAQRLSWIRDAPRRRRRRRLIAAAWSAVTVLAVVSTFQAFRLSTAGKRERLANRFGSEVQRIDSLMRVAYLSPLHDLAEDRSRIRRRMAWMRDHLEDVGEWGVAPGLFALGRGHLALGELEQAQAQLQQAWDHGYREPEAAFALGRTLTALYQQGLDRLRFITDDVRRDRERARIEAEFRDPAVRMLQACQGADQVQPVYVEGLLALCEGRFDDALDAAERSRRAGTGWQYEGALLEGRTRYLRGRDHMERGRRIQAEEDFSGAVDAFEAAQAVGRSDPRCRAGQCQVWRAVMEMRLYGAGGDLQEPFDRAVEACDASLAADRRQSLVLASKWACFKMSAESRMHTRPEAAMDALDQARGVAESLVAMKPGSALAHQQLGLTRVLTSIMAVRTGRDGIGDGRAGVRDLERAVDIEPLSAAIWSDLGNAHQYLGAAMEARDQDPVPEYLEAANAFRRAIEIRPDFVFAYNNSAAVELMLADTLQRRGEDPTDHADAAIENGRKALELKPDHLFSLANMAGASVIKGRYQASLGLDPTEALEQALDLARAARDLNPAFVPAYLSLAEGNFELAKFRKSTGEPVRPEVEAGLQAIAVVLEQAPGLTEAVDLRKGLRRLRGQ